MMLRRAAPLSDEVIALVPLIATRRADPGARWCRAAVAVVAGSALLALWRGVALTAMALGVLAAALAWLAGWFDRHRAAALTSRLAAAGGTVVTHGWSRAGPGAIALAEGDLLWLVDRSTAYQIVRLTAEQIAAAWLRRGWRGWRVALLYRLDPHEAARQSLIHFGHDRAAAQALVAHLTRP
jgi:hypothetical protein